MPNPVIETRIEDVLAKIDNRLANIESDLTDLRVNQARMEEKLSGQISAVDEKLSGQISAVDEKLSGQIGVVDEKLSGQIGIVEEKLSGQISVVDEKVTGLSKRLDFQEFVNRGILTALVVALIAGAAKLFGWLPTS